MSDHPEATENAWKNDRLDREEDSSMLFHWILNRHKNTNGGPLTINLNSGWGGGKTFFLNGFAQDLRASGFLVVEIDAWGTDFEEDPLPSIAAPILASLAQLKGKSTDGVPEVSARYLDAGRRILTKTGIGMSKRALELIMSKDDVKEVVGELGNIIQEAGEDVIEEVAPVLASSFKKQATDDFIEALEDLIEIAEKNNHPLPVIVLVDELDRCRPTYAIAFLERIKHLFEVENLAFVIATDTEQLEHTIQSVYGSGFDSAQYLKRFFEFTYSFQEPDLQQIVEEQLSDLVSATEGFAAKFPIIDFIVALLASGPIQTRDAFQVLETTNTIANFFPENELILPLLVTEIVAYRYTNGGIANLEAAIGNRSEYPQLNAKWSSDKSIPDTIWQGNSGAPGSTKVRSVIENMRNYLILSKDQIAQRPENTDHLRTLRDCFLLQIVESSDGFLPSDYQDIVARCGRLLPKADDGSQKEAS